MIREPEVIAADIKHVKRFYEATRTSDVSEDLKRMRGLAAAERLNMLDRELLTSVRKEMP